MPSLHTKAQETEQKEQWVENQSLESRIYGKKFDNIQQNLYCGAKSTLNTKKLAREQENYTSVQLARLTNQKSATPGQEPDKANQYLSGPITDECTPWEKALAEWVGECEGDWLSCLYLSRLLDRNKNSDQQHQLLNQCLQSEPIPGETMHWIGVWRLNSGDHTGAIEALSNRRCAPWGTVRCFILARHC